MSPAKKRPSKKTAPTPTHFFEVACPRVLSSMRTLCQERGGRFALVVDGEEGGAWTVDFTSPEVRRGREAADVTVTLTPAQFASLSTGKVELRKLVVDGAAPCEGARERLEDLALVLAFLERA